MALEDEGDCTDAWPWRSCAKVPCPAVVVLVVLLLLALPALRRSCSCWPGAGASASSLAAGILASGDWCFGREKREEGAVGLAEMHGRWSFCCFRRGVRCVREGGKLGKRRGVSAVRRPTSESLTERCKVLTQRSKERRWVPLLVRVAVSCFGIGLKAVVGQCRHVFLG